jgi:hypothetical protein
MNYMFGQGFLHPDDMLLIIEMSKLSRIQINVLWARKVVARKINVLMPFEKDKNISTFYVLAKLFPEKSIIFVLCVKMKKIRCHKHFTSL